MCIATRLLHICSLFLVRFLYDYVYVHLTVHLCSGSYLFLFVVNDTIVMMIHNQIKKDLQ